ncbi:MAG: DUF465 domain-containing protein [Erythrobacter sp.]|nr:MAG: DUF465 domain-containing protein [Erythrobacter sp.]
MKTNIFRLLQEHQRLDERLRLEQSRRWPNYGRISKLKKLKLAAKDALVAISRGRNPSRT